MASPLTIHALPEQLRRPVLIMAFAGWNDASEAATTAARTLARAWSAERFATIDPEEFYHFGLSRPHIRFKAGSRTEREVIWPATEFSAASVPELDRDGRGGRDDDHRPGLRGWALGELPGEVPERPILGRTLPERVEVAEDPDLADPRVLDGALALSVHQAISQLINN